MRALLENMKSGQVDVYDIPAPEVRPGGILVRTAFSAISSGTEKATVEAGRKSLLGKALARPDLVQQVVEYARSNGVKAAQEKVQARLDTLTALGYSCSGVVIEVGAGVTGFQPGERVACAGVGYASHSEINFVPANLAVRIPDNVSLEAASLTTIAAIAIQGIRQANVTFGETVAVVGAGLVGMLAIQVLRASGCRVIAFDISKERAAQATLLGAHLGLCTNEPGLRAAVSGFSRYGVDAAIITAATKSAEPLDLAATVLRDRGRISVVGDIGMGVARANMYGKELSLSMSRSYGPGRYDPSYEERGQDYPIGFVRWTENRNMEAYLDLLSAGALEVEPLLARRFPAEEASKAYAAVEAGAYTAIIDYGVAAKSPGQVAQLRSRRSAAPVTDALRVGCIGAGNFARGVIFPHLRSVAGLTLQSVAANTGSVAESARAGYGFAAAESPSDLLSNPDLDAIFICTRHDSHAAYVQSALKRGKKVFVEKPLAVSDEQLESVRAAYVQALEGNEEPFVMVGFNRRFAPLTAKLKAFFAPRVEPMMVHIRINAGYIPKSSWIQAPENGGRIIGELCHFVDWARAVIGSPVRSIRATALPDGAKYNHDNLNVTITFADGSLANLLYLANGDKGVAKEFYEVFCAGAIARLEDFKTLSLSRNGKTETVRSAQDKGHRRELDLTIAAMKQGHLAPIAFGEILEISQATLAVDESIRTQRVIELAENVTPPRNVTPPVEAPADENP